MSARPIRFLGGCTRAIRVLGLPDDHCGSCHHDEDAGYGLCELSTRAGYYEVCCTVSAAHTERWNARDVSASHYLTREKQPK